MKKIVIGVLLFCSFEAFSQVSDSVKSEGWEKIYRASATKINDLVHTKLVVSFDYSKSWMYGKAWITLHPHFYSTDSLNLDARSMSINEVSMIKAGKHLPLKYSYDKHNLRIILDKTYKGGENYTVFIDYVAKPDDIKVNTGMAMLNNKGLFFINPLGKDKKKPIQIWTQGETESNSGWFPTIDKPNQKTTDEISMTVPGKYQTLSNGVLVSQKKNSNGTRTDTWKMDLPHAPYLMMMVVGEYSVIKDSYKGKEVSYYVEKEYAPVARKIFGLTPEMIAYFSKITGIDYPWPKYAQITGRDFIAGAMENTTATLHGDIYVQRDARQLIDRNDGELNIAHELFHQWFGDYVTTESWSNTTVNESFADYSETLWDEYKYGKDAGDEHNYNGMQDYLSFGDGKRDLVRFYYKDQIDMFDLISYQKGGRILNMLRNYVGDSAFFKSLNLFLTTKKFQSAEAQDIRLAFEEVTGQDLNWFWNQWYFGSGHPKLDISYDYDAAGKTAKVFIKQNQPDKIFRFPIAVDVYQGGEKKRYKVWVDKTTDTLSFPASSKPDLINVDGDKILLCEKTDHKTLDNCIFQYHNAGLYVDRREAIEFAATKQNDDPKALDLLKTALKDRFPGLIVYTILKLNIENESVKNDVESLLVNLAKNDPKSLVRAAAIEALGKYKKETYKQLFLKSINDSSYSVSGNALLALGSIDSAAALKQAILISSQPAKGTLFKAINLSLFKYSGESEFNMLSARFENLPSWNEKFDAAYYFSDFLKRVNNTSDFRKGIDLMVNIRDSIPENRKDDISFINSFFLGSIATNKQSSGLTEQAEYVNSKLPAAKNGTAYNVPMETLLKYPGEYIFNDLTIKIILKEGKTLNFIVANSPAVELVPVSKNKFTIKFMEDQAMEFICNEKNEVTALQLLFPGGQINATRKK
ncbi:MAG TPA: M1 family metallopeptidase [Bacteroidales bacterium]